MTRNEHLLVILAEECAEVAQRATKILRFGFNEVQPEQELTNWERLLSEYADLVTVYEMVARENGLPEQPHAAAKFCKREKVGKFLRYSEECGTLKG